MPSNQNPALIPMSVEIFPVDVGGSLIDADFSWVPLCAPPDPVVGGNTNLIRTTKFGRQFRSETKHF